MVSVAMIRHSDTFVWVGLYICDEKYRGKGYAFKTWQAARAALNDEAATSPRLNLALFAVMSAYALYEKEGFVRSWMATFYSYSVESILEAYKTTSFPDDIITTIATGVDFAKLRLYVEDVMGLTFTQPGLLEKWISLPTHKALVALNKNGDVVGFATAKETIDPEKNGYRLGPFMADNSSIARLVLYKLAGEVSAERKFIVYVPSAETNSETTAINTEVKGQSGMDIVLMNTGSELPIKKEKYFGIFSPELLG